MPQRRKAIRRGVPRKPRQYPEEALQKTVAIFLDHWLLGPALWWATPNQKGTRSTFEQQLLVALGVKEGIPDIWVLFHGRLHGIELKAPPKVLKRGASRAKPRLSDAQKEMHPRLEAAGAVVTVARSLEEVERFLRLHGVPLRASALSR